MMVRNETKMRERESVCEKAKANETRASKVFNIFHENLYNNKHKWKFFEDNMKFK